MKNLGKKIRMSYLDAADGPRIMLFGPMDVDLNALQNFFRKMSQTYQPVRLDEQEFVVAFGDIQVLTNCTGGMLMEKKGQNRQGIYRQHGNPKRFEWLRSAEGWDYLAELIDGLLQSSNPSHQYLTRYPGEDAIVVVSKGEYSDAVLDEALRPDAKQPVT